MLASVAASFHRDLQNFLISGTSSLYIPSLILVDLYSSRGRIVACPSVIAKWGPLCIITALPALPVASLSWLLLATMSVRSTQRLGRKLPDLLRHEVNLSSSDIRGEFYSH